MSRITCTWNPEKHSETKITIKSDFKDLHYIERLDFLQDIIGDLTTLYNQIISDRKSIENDNITVSKKQ